MPPSTHSPPPRPPSPILKRPRPQSPSNSPTTSIIPSMELSRGAEGLVTRIPYLGRVAVKKERFPKRYRHPLLDAKLTSRRLSQEARMLLRLRKAGISVPAVYHVDPKANVLILEFLNAVTLKAFLQQPENNSDVSDRAMRAAGREVACMHKCRIVHGDLTTGNVMVGEEERVFIIDFGLSGGNATDEDLAVDLYVLERAVVSAHSEAASPLNDAFLDAYAKELKKPSVLKRLEEVRARGRKRDMMG